MTGQSLVLSRAVHFHGAVQGGQWNMVYSGCTGDDVPANNSRGGVVTDAPNTPDQAVVTNETTPRVRLEKPFIVMNTKGEYELHVPQFTSEQTVGPQLDDRNSEARCFSNVKVGKAFLHTDANGHYSEVSDDGQGHVNTDTDTKITLELQQALDEGKDLVLCPGMYFLTQPLIVHTVNQVILGLGMATLVAPHDGSPCIRVIANTTGVRIAGLMLEASVQNAATSENNNSDGTKSLLDFGEPETNGKKDSGDPANPGLIADLYSRVGGSNLNRSVTTDVMVRIFSSHVICDNLW